LERFVDQDPNNPGIMARQAHIQELRSDDFEDNSAFGEKSLSGRFSKEYSMVLKSGPADIDNTNIELGLTYIDMGLFQEAFLEFEQAYEDVNARHDAIYYLAICEFELDAAESATRRLRELLADATVPARLHRVAASKLEALHPNQAK
jgi:tetratricopeptide (TPR) repeat protein